MTPWETPEKRKRKMARSWGQRLTNKPCEKNGDTSIDQLVDERAAHLVGEQAVVQNKCVNAAPFPGQPSTVNVSYPSGAVFNQALSIIVLPGSPSIFGSTFLFHFFGKQSCLLSVPESIMSWTFIRTACPCSLPDHSLIYRLAGVLFNSFSCFTFRQRVRFYIKLFTPR